MRKLPLLFLLALAQCRPSPEKETTQNTAPSAEAALEGFWVNDAWWKLLQATQSPKEASDKAGISSVVIQQDSTLWVADVSYGWHEGMRYSLKSKAGGFDLINYMGDNEKMHELYPQSDGTLRIDSFVMVRIGDVETGWQIVPYTILGGSYTRKGTSAKVEFKADGTVTGLGDYSNYDILADYVTDEIGADQMTLWQGEEPSDFFVFEKKDGKLLLYITEEKTDSEGYTIFAKGPLRFELEKEK